MLRGCQRGNQVLIFLSEADLPLELLAMPLSFVRFVQDSLFRRSSGFTAECRTSLLRFQPRAVGIGSDLV